ncbi:MAG: hypothetical protein EU536_03035 [Promethearchaeota archaeon]|nr:MAG: hypothetical protein EU536_03035 [Candidatus Lokiarchaeota archaeon]
MKKINFWKRHANPISGWSRIATAPLFASALWFVRYGTYTWIPLVVVLIWVILNPIIFRKPKHLDRWISQGVLAEQWWVQELKREFKFDFTLFCNVMALLAFIPMLVIAFLPTEMRYQLMWPYIYCSTLAFIFKIWFVDRVVFQYEKYKQNPSDASSLD